MKKIFLIMSLIVCLAMAGCSLIYNLTNFTIPNDTEFLATIESLNTPQKICKYMEDNFEWEFHTFSYSPYQMWLANVKTKAGDCNDYSCFAIFVANYHGYETYQIRLTYFNEKYGHMLAVYVENNRYNYSSNMYYCPIQVFSFEQIIYQHCLTVNKKLKKYRIYNYNMEVIEIGG